MRLEDKAALDKMLASNPHLKVHGKGDKGAGEKVEGRAVPVRQEVLWEKVRGSPETAGALELIVGVEYPVSPVTKPRQTRSDKWKKRPCVIRYREYADKLRALKAKVPESGAHVTFVVPLPKSWSEKRKKAFDGAPHKVKPDADNLLKALLDALHKDDSHIWDIRVTKVWGRAGAIRVKSGEAERVTRQASEGAK